MAAQEIVITREFNAPRERVWKAWTDPETVKLWYGPEGFTSPSIRIDLRVGGMYIWSMQGPPGSPMDRVMHVAGTYQEIIPNEKLAVVEHMSDENGKAVDSGGGVRQMAYTVAFEALEHNRTRLTITYPRPQSEAEYQMLLKSGMVEGWQSSFNKLAQALG